MVFSAVGIVFLFLLERVINGTWNAWFSGFKHVFEDALEAVSKVLFSKFCRTVSVGRSNQLWLFWGEKRRKGLRVNISQSAAQPHVKEVCQAGIANVVVVWRISRNDRCITKNWNTFSRI